MSRLKNSKPLPGSVNLAGDTLSGNFSTPVYTVFWNAVTVLT